MTEVAMKIVGFILIAIGLIGVVYGGINWTTRKDVVDLGVVKVSQNETQTLPLPPIAGAVCLVIGTVLVVKSSKA
jgi:uncharacterized membrane protein YidH (DUF202 family)